MGYGTAPRHRRSGGTDLRRADLLVTGGSARRGCSRQSQSAPAARQGIRSPPSVRGPRRCWRAVPGRGLDGSGSAQRLDAAVPGRPGRARDAARRLGVGGRGAASGTWPGTRGLVRASAWRGFPWRSGWATATFSPCPGERTGEQHVAAEPVGSGREGERLPDPVDRGRLEPSPLNGVPQEPLRTTSMQPRVGMLEGSRSSPPLRVRWQRLVTIMSPATCVPLRSSATPGLQGDQRMVARSNISVSDGRSVITNRDIGIGFSACVGAHGAPAEKPWLNR